MPEVPITGYFEPSDAAARAFFSKPPSGPIVMLNLLRFRAWANYSANPELEPSVAITGEAAYRKYIEHTFLTSNEVAVRSCSTAVVGNSSSGRAQSAGT